MYIMYIQMLIVVQRRCQICWNWSKIRVLETRAKVLWKNSLFLELQNNFYSPNILLVYAKYHFHTWFFNQNIHGNLE